MIKEQCTYLNTFATLHTHFYCKCLYRGYFTIVCTDVKTADLQVEASTAGMLRNARQKVLNEQIMKGKLMKL